MADEPTDLSHYTAVVDIKRVIDKTVKDGTQYNQKLIHEKAVVEEARVVLRDPDKTKLINRVISMLQLEAEN